MTTSTTTTAVTTSTTGTAVSPSPRGGAATDPPRVVRHRASGRLVGLVMAVCLAVAAASWIAAHREAAPAAPVVTGAAGAPVAAVGDASHGGPGSRADAVRFVPPRHDDRAVLAHGGSGRVVSGFGASRAQLS